MHITLKQLSCPQCLLLLLASGLLPAASFTTPTRATYPPHPPTQSTHMHTYTYLNTVANPTDAPATRRRLGLPGMDVEKIGLAGRWKMMDGNFVLYPTGEAAPKAIIHFLGGAFVGAAPHIMYRYLLEALAEDGYLIVCTPYSLDFDYLRICDLVLERFDATASRLSREFGAVPVVGLGHSLGALLQVLITSLFPNAPRSGNVLISFNNKPVREAVPAFEELIVPLAEVIMSDSSSTAEARRSLTKIGTSIDAFIDTVAASDFSPAFVELEVVPFFRQARQLVEQLPSVLRSLKEGTREFTPSPFDTKEACRRMYRARRTLLIKFDSDQLDETDDIMKALEEARTIIKMRRPLAEIDVETKVMRGSHITPLTQNIALDPPEELQLPDPFKVTREQFRKNFLQTLNEVKADITAWLDTTVQ